MRRYETLVSGGGKRRPTALAALAAFVLMLAACGGAEDAPSADTAATPEEQPETAQEQAQAAETEEDAPPYYEGKSLTIVNSHPPGGGTAVAAEFHKLTMEMCLEGVEEVTVDYTLTGSTGDVAVAAFQSTQPRDGTVIQHIGSGYAALHVLDDPDIAGTLDGTRGLAAAPTSAVVYARSDLGFSNIVEFVEYVEGGGDITAVTSTFSGGRIPIFMAWPMFGVADDINIILGYDGDSGARLAFDQGEGNLTQETSESYVENVQPVWGPEEGDGSIVPLFQAGLGVGGDIIPDPTVPDIPTVKEAYEMINGEPPSGEDWEHYVDWMNAAGAFYLFTHDDIPQEAYDALAAAYDTCAENAEWQEALEDWMGPDAPLVWGADAQAATDKWGQIGDDFRDWFSNMVETHYPFVQ